MYLFINKRALKRFGRLDERELRVFRSGKSDVLDRFEPRIIHRRPEVVNCISGDEREVGENGVDSLALMFDRLASGLRVDLNATNATIWQRENNGIYVRDVLIGPLNL
jgi:hypothetical protein